MVLTDFASIMCSRRGVYIRKEKFAVVDKACRFLESKMRRRCRILYEYEEKRAKAIMFMCVVARTTAWNRVSSKPLKMIEL